MKILLMALTVTAAGCAILSAPGVTELPTTLTLAADYDRSFSAVLSYCRTEQYPVVVTDYPGGIISTAYRPPIRITERGGGIVRMRCKFRLSRIEPHRTSVVALTIIEQVGRDGAWEPARRSGAEVRELEDRVLHELACRLPCVL